MSILALTTFEKLSKLIVDQNHKIRSKIVIFVLSHPNMLNDFIYLGDYKKHPDAKINPALLWEYDLSDFDYQQMRNIVVQKVIERGWPNDWWAALNLYGEKGMKDAIKAIAYFNDKDMNFVSKAFQIPLSKMKCYKNQQLQSLNGSF